MLWINVELMTASNALPVISLVINEPTSTDTSPLLTEIAPTPLAAKLVKLTISLMILIVYSPLTPVVKLSNKRAS